MRNAVPVLMAAMLALGSTACAHRRAPSSEAAPTAQSTVKVENQGFADMDIFVLASGQRIRLGTATGNATTTFVIPSYLVGGANSIRFLADPIGGTRAPVSEEITVRPGDQVTLTIPPGS